MMVEKLKQMGTFKESPTEQHAIDFLKGVSFDTIKSIGISTAGYFEGFFAECGKKVTATTLDKKGMEYTKNLLKGTENLKFRLEDVTQNMPEEDSVYDVIYSRLCLHYISDIELKKALAECYRVLKAGGHIIIVVKSLKDWTAKTEGAYYEPETGYTYTPSINRYSKSSRRLHSIQSITEALIAAGFSVQYSNEIQETIYEDYERKVKELPDATVIEVYGMK